MSKNVVTLKSGLKVTQGHWEWYHSIDCYGFLLVFFSNFVLKMHRFWDIRLQKRRDLESRVRGSLKVIENYTIRSGTHDFLLTFYSSYRPISHLFRNKRRFPSKIAWKSPIFPSPVYLTPPLKGFPLELGIGAGSEETRMMGLPDGGKKFSLLSHSTNPCWQLLVVHFRNM